MAKKIKMFIIKYLLPLSRKAMVEYLRHEGYTVIVPIDKK